MIEKVLDTPYGQEHVVRYESGWFWVDSRISFDRKRVKRLRPIRGIPERRLLRRVVQRPRDAL